jgi:hypothetical protein
MSGELQRHTRVEVFEGNAMGIVAGAGTPEEKLGRLAALVPMALEFVDEARETVPPLREDNERPATEDAALHNQH